MVTIEDVLVYLYTRGICASIELLYDVGLTVTLAGAERTFKPGEFDQIADWMLAHAHDPTPSS